VQGSGLSVDPGQSISFVGGDFTMTGGNLNARNGQVRIASVASTGEILHQDLRPAPNIKGDSFSGMGTINLSQGAVVNVSSNAAGIVKILGGQFVMTNATVSADTVNGAGAPVAIDINITGNMSIANDLAPALTAKSTGDGSAGAINITSANLKAITSPSNNLLALIDTHTSGMGTAGNITINTGDLHTINENFFIDSGSAGPGHGGDVTVSGTTIHIHGPEISTGNRRFGQLQGQEVTGSAGNLTISADSLKIEAANISTESFLARAGDLTLEAGHIHITGNSFVSVDGNLGGATITVNADQLTIDTASQLNSNTVVKPGGNINITARIVDLSNGGFIQTSTLGDGPAGNIHITAMERVTLDDRGNTIPRPSGLLSNSFGDFGSLGSSGAIDVITPRLEIIGGAQMNSSTRSSGQAGTITITADSISILGERPFETPESFIELGSTRASGIYTRTVGSELCAGPCGNAGNVTVTTGSLNLESGGTINSGTINSGAGGNITIYATNAITMSGTMIDGTSSGIFSRTAGTAQDSGTGGNITLTAGQSVTISNGASVSASSNGPGNAGNISVNAGQQFEMRDSSITTQATKATGGNINIQAIDRVRLVNSPISTSVRSGPGSGGNITIDPNVVVLQNSPITAQADRGAGGNITITTPLFLADSTSPVSASSQFGRNGTVTIQSPTSNLSESLGTLPSEPSQAQTLLTQRCAALVNNGQTSSFVVAGREQLPADPGGWLTSPLAFAAWGESLDAGPAIAAIPTVMAIAAQGTGTVSIRRLTPAGFLMANFADSAATGCSS
jgi:large exoprotein involved in heme utilization and adhesion